MLVGESELLYCVAVVLLGEMMDFASANLEHLVVSYGELFQTTYSVCWVNGKIIATSRYFPTLPHVLNYYNYLEVNKKTF